jgi:hypothetical protein
MAVLSNFYSGLESLLLLISYYIQSNLPPASKYLGNSSHTPLGVLCCTTMSLNPTAVLRFCNRGPSFFHAYNSPSPAPAPASRIHSTKSLQALPQSYMMLVFSKGAVLCPPPGMRFPGVSSTNAATCPCLAHSILSPTIFKGRCSR